MRVFDCLSRDTRPVRIWKDHAVEASCVAWSPHFTSTLASGGWDGRLNLHSLQHGRAVHVTNFATKKASTLPHGGAARSACSASRSSGSVHSVQWHPQDANTLLVGDASGHCSLVDVRAAQPVGWEVGWGAGGMPPPEVLAVSWLSQGPHVLAGTSHGCLAAFDIRQLQQPLSSNTSHSLGVKALSVLPPPPGASSPLLVASASYDCTVKVWDGGKLLLGGCSASALRVPAGLLDASSALVGTYQQHSEFVTDVQWLGAKTTAANGGNSTAAYLASVGWDEKLAISQICVGPSTVCGT